MKITSIPQFLKGSHFNISYADFLAVVKAVRIRPIIDHYYETEDLEWLLDVIKEVRLRYEERKLYARQADISNGKES